MIDFDKLDKISELPISEEMLGAYLEGNLDLSEAAMVESMIDASSTLGEIFDECSALDSICVTSMLAGVENFAFSDCVSLKNIYFTGSVEQWKNVVLGDKAFFEHQYDITVHCTDGEIIIEK